MLVPTSFPECFTHREMMGVTANQICLTIVVVIEIHLGSSFVMRMLIHVE